MGQCLFIDLATSSIFVSYSFPFLFFHSIGWYFEPEVFVSLSPSLALQTFFNDNNNNYCNVKKLSDSESNSDSDSFQSNKIF